MRAKQKVETIMQVVADHFELQVEQIKNHDRHQELVRARQMIHYLSRELTKGKVSYQRIGKWTGNGKAWDHATVMHSIKTVDDTISRVTCRGEYVYQDYREDYREIKDSLSRLL